MSKSRDQSNSCSKIMAALMYFVAKAIDVKAEIPTLCVQPNLGGVPLPCDEPRLAAPVINLDGTITSVESSQIFHDLGIDEDHFKYCQIAVTRSRHKHIKQKEESQCFQLVRKDYDKPELSKKELDSIRKADWHVLDTLYQSAKTAKATAKKTNKREDIDAAARLTRLYVRYGQEYKEKYAALFFNVNSELTPPPSSNFSAPAITDSSTPVGLSRPF